MISNKKILIAVSVIFALLIVIPFTNSFAVVPEFTITQEDFSSAFANPGEVYHGVSYSESNFRYELATGVYTANGEISVDTYGITIPSGANVTIEGGVFTAFFSNYGSLVINDATVTVPDVEYPNDAIYLNEGSTTVINGGEFNGRSSSAVMQEHDMKSLVISGGSFTGYRGLTLMPQGDEEYLISGGEFEGEGGAMAVFSQEMDNPTAFFEGLLEEGYKYSAEDIGIALMTSGDEAIGYRTGKSLAVVSEEETSETVWHEVVFYSTQTNHMYTTSVEDGKVVELPDTFERTGYTLDGWFLDEEYTKAFDVSQPITEDVTVYARWKSNVELTEITEVHATLFAPVVGTEITVTQHQEETEDGTRYYMEQSNSPVVTIPADVNYTVEEDNYWTLMEEGGVAIYEGTIAEGELINCFIGLNVMPGYVFSKDVKFYVNGELSEVTYWGEDRLSTLAKIKAVSEAEELVIEAADNSEVKAKIEFPEGLDITGYQLSVVPSVEEISDDLANKNVKVVFDVNVLKNGVVQKISDTKMKITIELPEELQGYESYTIVYIVDGEIKEEIEATVEGEVLTFYTTHLSEYGVVATGEAASITPATGDSIAIYVALFAIACVGIIAILKRK